MNTLQALQKNRSVNWITVIVLGIIIIMNEIPIIPRVFFGNATMLPFALFFLLLSSRKIIRINTKYIPIMFAFLVLVMMMLIYKITGVSSTGWGIYINTLSHYFFFFSMLVLVDQMNEKQQRFIFVILISSLVFSIVQNTFLYFTYGFDYFLAYVQDESIVSNAMSTQFSTAIVLFGAVLLIAFLNSKKHKMLWLLFLIIVTYFNVFIAQRTINMILTVALYTYIVLINKKRKIYANILLLLGALLLLFVIYNYDATITFLSDIIGSDRISDRLLQIKRVLDTGDVLQGRGSLTARYRLYTLSLDTWLSTPHSFFFGIGEHYENNQLIGNHSQFLDVLGQYGLIGAMLLYSTVVYTLKTLMDKLPIEKRSPIYRQVLAVVVVFVIRGFVGTVLYGVVAIHLFIFMPLAIKLIKKGEVA